MEINEEYLTYRFSDLYMFLFNQNLVIALAE